MNGRFNNFVRFGRVRWSHRPTKARSDHKGSLSLSLVEVERAAQPSGAAPTPAAAVRRAWVCNTGSVKDAVLKFKLNPRTLTHQHPTGIWLVHPRFRSIWLHPFRFQLYVGSQNRCADCTRQLQLWRRTLLDFELAELSMSGTLRARFTI